MPPLLTTVELLLAGRLVLLPDKITVPAPAFTVSAPVNKLLPESVKVPAPPLVTPPVPETIPPTVVLLAPAMVKRLPPFTIFEFSVRLPEFA